MRKVTVLTLVVAMLAFVLPAQGQFFIMGGTGLDVGTEKTISTAVTTAMGNTITAKAASKNSEVGFLLGVGVGYQFSSLFSLGGTLGYHLEHSKAVGSTGNDDALNAWTTVNFNMFNFHPFVRIAPFNFGNVQIYMDLGMPLSVGKGKSTTNAPLIGKVTADIGTRFILGITMTPGIAFNLNQNFSIFTNLRFLQIGYNYDLLKNPPTKNTESKEETHQFFLGTLKHKGLGIGLIYKF